MKILSTQNNHAKKSESEKEYGCICNKCNTAFIFKRSEAYIPRCPNPELNCCTVVCPNCHNIMTLAQCKEFKTIDDKIYFEHEHDE